MSDSAEIRSGIENLLGVARMSWDVGRDPLRKGERKLQRLRLSQVLNECGLVPTSSRIKRFEKRVRRGAFEEGKVRLLVLSCGLELRIDRSIRS